MHANRLWLILKVPAKTKTRKGGGDNDANTENISRVNLHYDLDHVGTKSYDAVAYCWVGITRKFIGEK
jgi:hypothetical protein